MNNEILEETFIENDSAKKYNKYYPFIVLIILWFLISLSLIINAIFDIQTTFSICFLVFATILTFKNKKYGVRFTFFLLFISIFHLLRFNPIKLVFEINFLSINVDYFFLAILHYVLNEKYLFSYFREIIHGSKEKQQEEHRSKINLFKHRFIEKSSKELENIIAENKLVSPALSATKEILEERKKEVL